MDNIPSARLHLEKALKIWSKSLPIDHVYLKQLHLHLSQIYMKLQMYADATRHGLIDCGMMPADSSSVRSQPDIPDDDLD